MFNHAHSVRHNSTQAVWLDSWDDEKIQLFLNFAETHPDTILRYRWSDMVLADHSDAPYLNDSKACDRAGEFFWWTIYLSQKTMASS